MHDGNCPCMDSVEKITMEFTNLLFAVLIAALFSMGISVFISDAKVYYPALNNSNSTIGSLNDSFAELNTNISMATNQSVATNPDDTGFGAAFGYLFGAFNSVTTLVGVIPHAFSNTITVISGSMGIALFSPIIPLIYTAIAATVLIGILYYLMKVK